jgi:hypothetical protein
MISHTWFYVRAPLQIRETKLKRSKIHWGAQRPKYVPRECGWLWPNLAFRDEGGATMMNGAPPLDSRQRAVVNDETARATLRWGYFESGASSSSAGCTTRGRFYAFANREQKSIVHHINNALRRPHARND